SGVSQPLRGVAHSGAMWVAAGDGGTLLTSPDGVTWTSRSSGTTQALWGVAHSGGDPAPMPGEPTELGGRSSTGTLAAASLDTQLSLSGRSASGARVEADVDTGVRLA